jgi:hypothetical protein
VRLQPFACLVFFSHVFARAFHHEEELNSALLLFRVQSKTNPHPSAANNPFHVEQNESDSNSDDLFFSAGNSDDL